MNKIFCKTLSIVFLVFFVSMSIFSSELDSEKLKERLTVSLELKNTEFNDVQRIIEFDVVLFNHSESDIKFTTIKNALPYRLIIKDFDGNDLSLSRIESLRTTRNKPSVENILNGNTAKRYSTQIDINELTKTHSIEVNSIVFSVVFPIVQFKNGVSNVVLIESEKIVFNNVLPCNGMDK